MKAGGPSPDEFGKLLRKYREDKYSQEQFAQKVGVATTTIQELEQSRTRVPQVKNLNSICDALELSFQQRTELIAAARRRKENGAVRVQDAGQEATQTATEPSAPAANADAVVPPSRSARLRRLSSLSRRARTLLILGVITVVAGTAGGTAWYATRPMVAVEWPADGQQVESPLTVNGTAKLPSGSSLWLLVRPVGDTTYYLTDVVPAIVNQDGRWASRLTLGRDQDDEGEEYDLFALVVPNGGVVDRALANKPVDQFSARFKSIPNDVEAVHRIRVVLDEFIGS